MGPGILAKAPIKRVRGPGTYWAGFGPKVAFRLCASHLACGHTAAKAQPGALGYWSSSQELKCRLFAPSWASACSTRSSRATTHGARWVRSTKLFAVPSRPAPSQMPESPRVGLQCPVPLSVVCLIFRRAAPAGHIGLRFDTDRLVTDLFRIRSVSTVIPSSKAAPSRQVKGTVLKIGLSLPINASGFRLQPIQEYLLLVPPSRSGSPPWPYFPGDAAWHYLSWHEVVARVLCSDPRAIH